MENRLASKMGMDRHTVSHSEKTTVPLVAHTVRVEKFQSYLAMSLMPLTYEWISLWTRRHVIFNWQYHRPLEALSGTASNFAYLIARSKPNKAIDLILVLDWLS